MQNPNIIYRHCTGTENRFSFRIFLNNNGGQVAAAEELTTKGQVPDLWW